MASIEFFAKRDENGELVSDESGALCIKSGNERGQRTDLSVLRNMYKWGKSTKAIERHLPHVANDLNWKIYEAWEESQNAYLVAFAVWEEYQRNPYLDEEGNAVTRVPPTLPEPINFEPYTVETVRNLVTIEQSKIERKKRNKEIANIRITIEVDGAPVEFDGDEDAQTRIDRAARVMRTKGILTQHWKGADNNWYELTADQLDEILLQSGMAQTTIMQRYP